MTEQLSQIMLIQSSLLEIDKWVTQSPYTIILMYGME